MNIELDRPRAFDVLALAFLSGVCLYFALPSEPVVWLPFASVLAAIILSLALKSLRVDISLGFLISCLFFVGLSAGISYPAIYASLRDTRMVTKKTPPQTYRGVVRSIDRYENTTRLVMAAGSDKLGDDQRGNLLQIRFAGRLQDGLDRVNMGDTISVSAILEPVPGPVVPSRRNRRINAYFSGLTGQGFATGTVSVIEAAEYVINSVQFRDYVYQRIITQMSNDGGALAAALLVGKRSGLSQEIYSAFRGSGLAHLLAISGLHVGLVTAMVFSLIRRVLALFPAIIERWPVKSWAAIGAICVALGYVMLSGASVPTVRAFIMSSFVLLAIVMHQRALSKRLVVLSAILLVFMNPAHILDPSFQMSFAAVFSLIATYTMVRDMRGPGRGLQRTTVAWHTARYGLAIIISTLVAGVATAPFSAAHFNTVTTYGAIANLAAVPITGFWIMPLGFLSIFLMPLGLEQVFLWLLDAGLSLLISVAQAAAALPNTTHSLASSVVPFTTLAAICLLGAGWSRRVWHRLVWCVVFVGCWMSVIHWPSKPNIFVRSGGRAIAVLVDDSIHLFGTREKSYAARVWQESSAAHRTFMLPQQASKSPYARCDFAGCAIEDETGEILIQIMFTPQAVWLACREQAVKDAILLSMADVPYQTLQACTQDILSVPFQARQHGAASYVMSRSSGLKIYASTNNKSRLRPWRFKSP